jgi:hypothetical protein
MASVEHYWTLRREPNAFLVALPREETRRRPMAKVTLFSIDEAPLSGPQQAISAELYLLE